MFDMHKKFKSPQRHMILAFSLCFDLSRQLSTIKNITCNYMCTLNLKTLCYCNSPLPFIKH